MTIRACAGGKCWSGSGRSRLTSIQSTGRKNWTSLQKDSNRATLWADLASTTVSAEISSTYGRLRDMAVAWATPGQTMYQDAGLLTDIPCGFLSV